MHPLNMTNVLKATVMAASSAAASAAVAKCDEFLPLAGGPSGTVMAFAVYNNTLIAGGLFATVGANDTARSIAQFDGQSWSTMNGGMGGGGSQPGAEGVRALAVYNGDLIAGGYFTRAGGVQCTRIGRWNGREWSPLGEGMAGPDDPAVFALTVFNGQLIAAGRFATAGEAEAANIARWDGRAWAPIGGSLDSPVYALTVYDGRLIAGGENFIMSWDGRMWTPHAGDPQLSGTVRVLMPYNGQLIAGGHFVGPSGATQHAVIKSNGTQWSPVGNDIFDNSDSGSFAEIRALAIYNGDLIAAGVFSSPGASIARFNGTTWMPMSGALPGGAEALTIYQNALTVGAHFVDAGSGNGEHVAAWYDCVFQVPGDVNDNGVVDLDDLLNVIAHWGACPDTAKPCIADVAPAPGGDGQVNIADVLTVIANWS